MRITRFFETPDGGSRFEEVDLAIPQPHTDQFGNTYHLSKPLTPLNGVIVELPHGLDQDWHVAPNRQIVFVLRGVLEVQTTDGEKRQWRAGGMFMADDPRGKGHQTRVVEGPAQLLFLRMSDDFGFKKWIG
jgi:quercetin dioxygenase-like cupin family protein